MGEKPRKREDYKAGYYDERTGDYKEYPSSRTDSHQTFSDRIWGSPDDWRKDDSTATDNRWDPGKYSNKESNQQTDNPSSVIDVAGQNHGPGPGPGPGGHH